MSGSDALMIAVVIMVVQLVLLTAAVCRLAHEVRALTNAKRQQPESGCWRSVLSTLR